MRGQEHVWHMVRGDIHCVQELVQEYQRHMINRHYCLNKLVHYLDEIDQGYAG
jgi:hypothetical protein